MVRNTMGGPPGAVWNPNAKIRHTFGWVTRRASWICASALQRGRVARDGPDRLEMRRGRQLSLTS
jgi:hypothetical protein